MSVKNQLIKIAYENPELRDSLLPIINKVAYPKAKNQELWEMIKKFDENKRPAWKLMDVKEIDAGRLSAVAARGLEIIKEISDGAKKMESAGKLKGIPMDPFKDLEDWWKKNESNKDILNPKDSKVAGNAISKMYDDVARLLEECAGALGTGPKAQKYHDKKDLEFVDE